MEAEWISFNFSTGQRHQPKDQYTKTAPRISERSIPKHNLSIVKNNFGRRKESAPEQKERRLTKAERNPEKHYHKAKESSTMSSEIVAI